MRIAHISDLHLLALDGAVPWRLFNKRFTGWVNIKLKRGSVHKLYAARAVAHAIRDRGDIDHLVLTGDVTNLSLESEFEVVRLYLRNELGLSAEQISVVPGNHDTYTLNAYRTRRFERYLGGHLSSDLPQSANVSNIGRFPFVRLRGPVAIIGLSTAVPRPPLVASGQLGKLQRMALHSLLAHREVQARLAIIIQHHPWHLPGRRIKVAFEGLTDAPEQLQALDQLERGLLLHGHLHRRIRRTIPTSCGSIESIGSTSASLIHDDPDRMSGFNIYEIADDDGSLLGVEAFRLDVAQRRFVPTAVPEG